jgi:peptide/nickel transport system permease protein
MFAILRDLFRYKREFRVGAILTTFIAAFASLSFVSPYPPQDQFVVPPDLPPSWAYWFGN